MYQNNRKLCDFDVHHGILDKNARRYNFAVLMDIECRNIKKRKGNEKDCSERCPRGNLSACWM